MTRKIPLDKFIVSYSELFDDFYVPVPWNRSRYVTKIGDILIGFGEEIYLRNALKKVREKYGDNINIYLVESKKIPFLSEPLVRRHGSLESTLIPRGKWVIYKDKYMTDPVVITQHRIDKYHRDMVIDEIGRYLEDADFAKGVFFEDPVKREGYIFIQQSRNIDVKKYFDVLASFFGGTTAEKVEGLSKDYNLYKVGVRKVKIKVYPLHIGEKELLMVEREEPYLVTWEDITGDEYTNKNRNEPELWRPIRQITTY